MQFQKVFVEELGKELLMDEQGNLFDLEGNFIGRAADDGQEMASSDDKYFEDGKPRHHELP